MNSFFEAGKSFNLKLKEDAKTSSQHSDFARAVNVLIVLRNQKGAEPLNLTKFQWLVNIDGVTPLEVRVARVFKPGEKVGMISPCFNSKKEALDAVDFIGRREVYKAFQILAGL